MKTAVILSLLIAVGLAFATFIALRKPAAPVATPVAWLAGLSESSIDSIRFSWGDKADDLRIQSDGAAGWKLERSTAKGGKVQWPVHPAQVRGGLRLLADLASIKHSDLAVMRNTQTTLVSFSKEGRDVGSLRLGNSGLGGQVPAIINDASPRFVFVDEALSRAFRREGILQWRAPVALSNMAGGAARVTISSPTSKVELARAQGRWVVNEPFRTPAADATVKTLLASLGGISISKFVDDAEGDETNLGFATPLASITVHTEQHARDRDGVARPVLVEEIEVGGPADVGRTSLFVRVRAMSTDSKGAAATVWGPIVGVVERSKLDVISGDAATYASKAVLRESALDVVSLRIADAKGKGTAFKRTIDGWFVLDASGQLGAKLGTEHAKAVQQLIEIMCNERATGVRDDKMESTIILSTVEAGVLDGLLPIVDVVVCSEAGKARVGLRTKGVLRLYADIEERTIDEVLRAVGVK